MSFEHSPPPRPPGPRWILIGFGLLFLSWLVFMGYYLWKLGQRPPPGEPAPVQATTNPVPTAPGPR